MSPRCLITLQLLFHVSQQVNALFFAPSGTYSVSHTPAPKPLSYVEYNVVGGTLKSSPSCLVTDGRRINCFYTAEDALAGYMNFVDGETYSHTFEGTVKGQPQVVGYGSHGVLAFFLTLDNQIAIVGLKTETNYDDKLTTLDYGTFLDVPGCTQTNEADNIFCAMRATDGDLYGMWNRRGIWSRPFFISDGSNGPTSCRYNTITNRIHCWTTNSRNILVERLLNDNGYPQFPFWFAFNGLKAKGRVHLKMLRGWIPLPRALGYNSNDMVDNLASYGGRLTSEPDCVQPAGDIMDCFALDESHGLQRNFQQMGSLYVSKTSGWHKYEGGPFVGNPSCVYVSTEQTIHCFVRDNDDKMVDSSFKKVTYNQAAT